MYSPLDQILIDEEFPELNNLLMKLSKLAKLQQIANVKGYNYIKYFYFIKLKIN